jgi:hypothetical protein
MKLSSDQPTKLQFTAEAHLRVGSQLFHNGMPVQLLYLIKQEDCREMWRVRPLFVKGPDRDEAFRGSDTISFLHTMRAPCWACAA